MIFVQIMHDSTRPYRGRFAPSPTGLLHFGSLVAAVGSYLEARWNRGRWLVRMEDLDRPREARGASKAILRMLEAYGFEWDGKVVFQSRRDAAYGAALKRLEHGHAVFPCACTRREISDSTVSAAGEPIYPGTCRKGPPPGRTARAMRVRVDNAVIAFEDLLQGRIEQNLGREVGDFIVRRADGKEVGAFGHYGKQAGQFHNIHQIVTDSKGNVYTGEVDTGMRVQKFTPSAPPAK